MNRIILAITLVSAWAGITFDAYAQDASDVRSPASVTPSPVPACQLFLPLAVTLGGVPEKPNRDYGVCGLATDGNGYVVDWDAGKTHNEALARQGDPEAMAILCKRSPKAEKLNWCQKSAATGNAESMYEIGASYAGGIVAPYDLKEAVRWLQMAADHGQTDAALKLAAFYDVGLGVERDSAIAESWRQKAGYRTPASDARAPDQCSWREGRPAPLLICEKATDGSNPAPDLLFVAFEGLTEHTVDDAEAGNIEAMNVLGSFYLQTGALVAHRTEREARGLALLKAAADRGDAVAPYLLGYAYEHKLLSDSTPGEALRWYRLGAERRNAPAMMALGVLYARGEHVTADPVAAGKALDAAAELDPRNAARIVGSWYASGRYVAQSDARAADFFRAAADAGDPRAMCPLANIYSSGKGTQKDEDKAAAWRRASAKAGFYCKPEGYGLIPQISRMGEPRTLEHCELFADADPHTGAKQVWCHPDDMVLENMQLVDWPPDDISLVRP